MLSVLGFKLMSQINSIHRSAKAATNDNVNNCCCPFKKFTVRRTKPTRFIRRGNGKVGTSALVASLSWALFTKTNTPEMDKLFKKIVFLNESTSVGIVKDICEADKLFDSDEDYDFDKILQLLIKHVDLGLPEVLWRLARLYHKISETTCDRVTKMTMLQEAVALADKALVIDDNVAESHLWKAMNLYDLSKMSGLSEYYQQIGVVKDHLQKAQELKPEDPLTYHLHGVLCLNIIELPQLVTVFVESFYGPLPKCTHEEALESFLQEEKIRTKPNCTNYYMLIKLFVHFKNFLEARDYIVKLDELKIESAEDLSAKEQSELFISLIAEEVRSHLEELAMDWHPPGPTEEEIIEQLAMNEQNEGIVVKIINSVESLHDLFVNDQIMPYDEESVVGDWEEDPLAWRKIKKAIKVDVDT